MRRFDSVLFAIAIVLVFLSCLAAAAPFQNESDETAESIGKDMAESPIKNPSFEESKPGKAPTDWRVPPNMVDFVVNTTSDNPRQGKQCATIECSKNQPSGFGNLMQSVPANAYLGKRLRYRAAVRREGDDCQAQLWFRVDCRTSPGTFDNMHDRPIKSDQWSYYEIVGDVADDARSISLGLIMQGKGKVFIDDVSLTVVDDDAIPTAKQRHRPGTPTNQIGPGLFEIIGTMQIRSKRAMMEYMWKRANANQDAPDLPPAKEEVVANAKLLLPLPLSYRDQVPLSYELTASPTAALKSVRVYEDRPNNFVAEVILQDVGEHKVVDLNFRSAVLVAPSAFEDAPKTAKVPDEWPEESKPWLQATWCADSDHPRIQKIAKSIRQETDDVMKIIEDVEIQAKSIFQSADGHVQDLTAVEALDKRGSCTSCGNLVAALLRASNVPARVLSGYPSWSGPLQTHYIVEAYVPNYGWYPVESTMCQSPWPNSHQINVAIIPPEYESAKLAGRRPTGAGGVPYLSLTEAPDNKKRDFFTMGTIKDHPGCDHECRLIRKIDAQSSDWETAMAWAKPRWAKWLRSNPKAKDGVYKFSINADKITSESVSDLIVEVGR